MHLALFANCGYVYFGAALDAAIECYRQHASAYIHRPPNSNYCWIYYASPVGTFAMLDATGRIEVENYRGDEAAISAIIILCGNFSY